MPVEGGPAAALAGTLARPLSARCPERVRNFRRQSGGVCHRRASTWDRSHRRNRIDLDQPEVAVATLFNLPLTSQSFANYNPCKLEPSPQQCPKRLTPEPRRVPT